MFDSVAPETEQWIWRFWATVKEAASAHGLTAVGHDMDIFEYILPVLLEAKFFNTTTRNT